MKVERLEWQNPTESSWWDGFATVMTWWTKCKQYKVSRVNSANPRFVSIVIINETAAQERIIQNDMNGLMIAFISVEKYHKKLTGCDVLESNCEAIVKEAEGLGLDVRPENRWADPQVKEVFKKLNQKKREKEYHVKERAARKLLKYIGYDESDFYKTASIQDVSKKLNRLDAVEEHLKVPEKLKYRVLKEECLEALSQGKRIVVKQSKEEPMNSAEMLNVLTDPSTAQQETFEEAVQASGYKVPVHPLVIYAADVVEEKPDGEQVEFNQPKVISSKKPGVFQTILDCVRTGTEESPCLKEAILYTLKEAFPGKAEKGLLSSINQAPYDAKKKGIIIKTKNKGFYVDNNS